MCNIFLDGTGSMLNKTLGSSKKILVLNLCNLAFYSVPMAHFKRVLTAIALMAVFSVFTSCKFTRFVVYNFADIKDYKIFPTREIENGSVEFQFYETEAGNAPENLWIDGMTYPFESFLEDTKTVAFLIIQNDTMQYEKYWRGYDEASIVPSFSIAKSVLSILIGCAIDDGLIQSVEESVVTYVPELKANGFEEVTIEHLLQMTSGLDFNEAYFNPFGEAATFYYGTDLGKSIGKLKLKHGPGERFEYISGNSQILGLLLERALDGKTISEYLEERIWKPLGMEYNASWSLDRENGLEKTFCCLNARARDFAKIGRLYLNKGNWNGTQIVSEEWVTRSLEKDVSNGSVPYYQYHWWFPSPTGDFIAKGFLGQYIYVNPDKNLVIVRLGKRSGKAQWIDILSNMGRFY